MTATSNPAIDYSVEQGDLLILADSKLVWRGRPGGMAVEKVVPLAPKSLDALALLDRAQVRPGRFQNLLRVRPDGEIVWMAELPEGGDNDSYVDLRYDSRVLTAWSWSGYHVRIDVKRGRIIRSTFVK